MNNIISKMRSELRHVLKESVAAYPGAPRDKWQFDWPSQIILVENQIFWCQEVEKVGRYTSSAPAWSLYMHSSINLQTLHISAIPQLLHTTTRCRPLQTPRPARPTPCSPTMSSRSSS